MTFPEKTCSSRNLATTEPLWLTASPLPVPEKARDVDLAKSYGRLVIRAGALRQRRSEEAREARERERDLLMTLIETDDDLLALHRGRRLAPSRAPGVDAVRRRLHRRLAAFGVKEIELEGRAVNTAYAEIAGTEETDAFAPDTVVETMSACFVWQGEVLRPGKVFVAVPPSVRTTDGEAAGPEEAGAEPGDAEAVDARTATNDGDPTDPSPSTPPDAALVAVSDVAAPTAPLPAVPTAGVPDTALVRVSEVPAPSGAPSAEPPAEPPAASPDPDAVPKPPAKREQPKRTTRAQRKTTQSDGRSGRAR